MGDILKSPPKWLVRPAKTLYVRRTSTLAVIHVAHSRVLLPGRGESPCRPRNAERPPQLAGKLLVHHEDGVVSTVGARLDSGVQWIALPPPIDDVAIPVTSGRQVDDLLPDSIAGFHLASVQVPDDFLGRHCRCQWPCPIGVRAPRDCVSLDRDAPILRHRGFLLQDL